ncbi:MAG: putative Ig domain-containing protein, partial [Candidatus Bipolaricaulaceae bacterium]
MWERKVLGLFICLVFSFVAFAQVIWEFNFDTLTPGTIPSGWSQTPSVPSVPGVSTVVKWQVISAGQVWGEPSTLRNFPSTPNALYFGVVDAAKGTGSYRDGNSRVGYVLKTSGIPMPTPRPNHIRVSFSHLRQVEYYGTGDKEYDISEVLYQWESVLQTPSLKRWSSKDPSGKVWEKFESSAIEVPQNGSLVLQFKFDSVDGNFNNYFGWLIDNLVVEVYPLTITTVGLPAGTVGQIYSETLEAVGGIGTYTWSVAKGYELPPRLTLSSTTGTISGTPERPGDYYVVFEVKDQTGKTSQKGFWIKIHPADQTGYTIFEEKDFASG